MDENSLSVPVPVPGREGEEGRLSLVVDAMERSMGVREGRRERCVPDGLVDR
jgi:hypothetical protein